MSFILDALRKSEQERQHGHVPVVSSVPLAVTAPRTPAWVTVVIIVLCAAVAALGWLWWRERAALPPQAGGLSEEQSTPHAAVGAPPVPLRRPAAPTGATPATRPATSAATAPTGALEVPPVVATETLPPVPLQAATAAPTDPPPAPAPGTRAAAPALPTRGELLAGGIDVPPLDLQLHVYADEATRRFVFMNGAKYTEGDALPGGPQVIEITTDGVRLRQAGRDFFLARN